MTLRCSHKKPPPKGRQEGDRSRPILCGWRVLSATIEPIVSSSGIAVHPEERLGDPTLFDYLVVVGGLIDVLVTDEPAAQALLDRWADDGGRNR